MGSMAATKRVSVTLDAPDQQAIEAFADHDRPERAVLEAWAARHGLSIRDDSDAAVLRTLILVGAEALRMKALEQGYERLAASHRDEQAERRALRDRAIRRSESKAAE